MKNFNEPPSTIIQLKVVQTERRSEKMPDYTTHKKTHRAIIDNQKNISWKFLEFQNSEKRFFDEPAVFN